MITVPYSKDKFDAGLKFVIQTIRNTLPEKEDDFLLLNCGFRGTGKSTISLLIEDEYLGDEASVDYIGLNPADFANALKAAKEKPLPRFCNNDEANISKRDTQRQYNKDLLDLYYSIRGKQIFHIWNNPSLDIIDKRFIEDIIKGVIFCFSKETKRPRLYYYFRKEDILKVWDKYEKLNNRILKKVADEYAFYRGWFKNYDGKLLLPYRQKKEKRMDEKIDVFHEKYGEAEKYLKRAAVMKQLNITQPTFYENLRELQDLGKLNKDNMITTITGQSRFTQEAVDVIREHIVSKRKAMRIET